MNQPQSVLRSKTIIYCFIVTVMMIMGVASVTPILPTLARHFGVPTADANLIIVFFTVPGLIVTPLAGIIADRWGAKKVLVPSLLLFGLGGVGSALMPDFESFLLCRFLQGAGSGAFGVLSLTIISDTVEDSGLRIKALGYNNSVMSVGAASIPLLSGVLAEISWELPLLLSGTALPLAFLVWLGMKTPPYKSAEPYLGLKAYLRATGKAVAHREVRILLLFTVINFMVIFGPLVTFYPELADSKFHATPFEIGMVMSSMSVGTMLVAWQISKISRRITTRSGIIIGFATVGAGLIMLPFAGNLLLAIIPLFVMGIGQGIFAPINMGCLISRAPYEQRSGVLAANGTLVRLAQSLGPLLFGFIYTGISLQAVFYIGGGIAVLACLLAYKGLENRYEC